MIAGEAANLLMNSGKAIQGMDFAMQSGVLAAKAAVEANKKKDFSAATLQKYRTALEESFVMKDMRQFQSAVHFLHTPAMFSTIPNLVCDFGRQFFTIDNTPTEKTSKMLKNSIKKYSSYSELIKIGIKGARSL